MLQAKSRKFKDKSDQQETALLDLTANLDECKGLHDALKKQLDAAHDEIAQHTETEAKLKEEIETTKTLVTTAKEEARKAKEENAYILFIYYFIISPFYYFNIISLILKLTKLSLLRRIHLLPINPSRFSHI